ncbi:MAG TPA: hypothetical protein VEX68_04155 [Bryobacteraceae bacterium]|nr:hypothetical protein [Bryobacteraceae bacterium]
MYSLRGYIYDDQNAEMEAEREKLGEEWIRDTFTTLSWDDSKSFVQRSEPAAVFLQNGRFEKPITGAHCQTKLRIFPGAEEAGLTTPVTK